MSNRSVNNKYQPGDTVYARKDPDTKLIIRRYYGQIYYCKIADHPERKELVYFERELD